MLSLRGEGESFARLFEDSRGGIWRTVIRIPNHRRATLALIVDSFIQPIQIKIGQQGRDHSSLSVFLVDCSAVGAGLAEDCSPH